MPLNITGFLEGIDIGELTVVPDTKRAKITINDMGMMTVGAEETLMPSVEIPATVELEDIVVEALEVFLNHILYLRDLYPQRIFKKRRVYNVPVYISTFPALNSYIHNVLQAARELQQRKDLQTVSLHLYHDEVPLNEYYTFEVKQIQPAINVEDQLEIAPGLLNDDKFLIDFEEQLRTSLYKLSERLNTLDKLPKGARFRIALNTTQEAFLRFSHSSHYQDFPWLCNALNMKAGKKTTTLLPLTRLDTILLKLNLEQFD